MDFAAKILPDSGSSALGTPTSLWEVAEASWASIAANDEVLSRRRMLEEAYDERIDAIKRATGEQLINPLRTTVGAPSEFSWPGVEQPAFDPEGDFAKKLQELAAKRPEHRAIIQPDVPILDSAKAKAREREQSAAEAFERYGPGMGKYAASLGAGLGRGFVDPVNLAAMAIGPWGTVGVGARSMLMMAAKQGLANAGVEGLMQPFIASWNQESGVGYDAKKFGANVGTAFLFGAGLDLGVRGAYRGIQRFRGNVPQLDAKGGVTGWVPPGELKPPPGTIVDMPDLPTIGEDMLARVRSGDVAAMTEIVERLNPDLAKGLRDGDPEAIYKAAERAGFLEVPEIKGAMDRFMIDSGDADALDQLQAEFNRVFEGAVDVDRGADVKRVMQVIRSFHDPDEPVPVSFDVVRRIADLSDEAELPGWIRGANQHEGRIEIDGRPVHLRDVDLKTAEIAQGVRGLNQRLDRLQGAWDAEQAGRVVGFEPLKGALQIVDGRARATLAQSADAASAPGIILKESDGWTRAEAEAVAALKNIQEGKGGLLETARAFRQHSDLADYFEASDDFIDHAKSLARLSEAAFSRVETGKVSPSMAALVGEYVAEAGQHARILDDLGRVGVTDLDEARRLLPYLMDTGDAEHRANAALLGLDPERSEMPVKAGAEVEEPGSPTAKAQLDQLTQELAPEIAVAKQLSAQAAQARDKVIELRREIAEREAALKAEPTEFNDPVSGEPMTREMVDGIISQWEFLREARKTKAPTSLAEFVKAGGGIEDRGGDVRSIIGGYKGRPGLARKAPEQGGLFGSDGTSGLSPDDWALRAWEQGYFPDRVERPSVDEFLSALDDDLNVKPIYRVSELDQAETLQLADATADELAQWDVHGARSARQIIDRFSEASRIQRKAELEEKRRELADAVRLEAIVEGRLAPAEAVAQKLIEREADVQKALGEVGGMVPAGVEVKTFSSVSTLPAAMQHDVMQANVGIFLEAYRAMVGAINPDGRAKAYASMKQAAELKAVEGFLSEHGDTIFISLHALDPKATLAHEAVHALKKQGRLTTAEMKLLADEARRVGVFDATREAVYRQEYAARSGGDVGSILDEEAAAHLIQARTEGKSFGPRTDGIIDRIRMFFRRLGNALRGYGFKTVDEVVQALVSGDVAKRAMSAAEMRGADITAMGIRAFHGSPHDFDRFDISKIGTGEGAQAFGHGLYFAENEGVAKQGGPAFSLRFMFAGERALTADKVKLAEAKEMDAAGTDRAVIWKQTGWFRGVDGKWRFEFSDHIMAAPYMPLGYRQKVAGAGFRQDYIEQYGYEGSLRDVYDHAALYLSYPQAADFKWRALPQESMRIPGTEAIWDRAQNALEIEMRTAEQSKGRGIVMHEVQHGIQDIENWSRGGAPQYFGPVNVAAEKARLALLGFGQIDDDNYIRNILYARLAGEVEARAVEHRMSLTPAERRERPPWEDYDVPESDQIVYYPETQAQWAASQRIEQPEPSPKQQVRTSVGGVIDAYMTLKQQADRLGVDVADLAGMVSRYPETAPLAARLDAARAQLAEVVGPERASALSEMAIRALPLLPDMDRKQVLSMLDGVLDQMLPDPPAPKPQMPDPAPPLVREMAEIDRIGEDSALVMACRV